MGWGGFQCLGELKDGDEGGLSEAAFELGDEGAVQAAHAAVSFKVPITSWRQVQLRQEARSWRNRP
jgi:hypothetical protein